jgi:preprotein translocase subunit SecG
MEIFKTIVIVLEVLASVAMILVVLFQSGKEAGLSGALGGKADTYLSKTAGGNLDKMLASATKWVALVWILLTLSLSFFPV